MKHALTLIALALATPAAAQTQTDMTMEAGASAKAADAAMNAQWGATYAAMRSLDARGGSGGGFRYAVATLASQRAWLKYRDSQCAIAAAEYRGGSAEPMAHSMCLAQLTKRRTQELKDLKWQH